MKRPASVTSALVVLFVFTVICAISAVAGLAKEGIVRALPGLLFIGIHLIPAIGLIRRKNWGRVFAMSVFGLWSLGFVFVGIYMVVKLHSWSGLVIELMISVLLAWQFLALLKSEAKVYFSGEVVPSP